MICLLLFTLTNSLWEDQLHTLQICRPFKVSRAQAQVNLWFPTSDTHMCMHAQLLSHVWLLVILWTIALQAPLPIRFPRQEYWSGLPFPSPGGLLNPGIKPKSPESQVYSLLLSHRGTQWSQYWLWVLEAWVSALEGNLDRGDSSSTQTGERTTCS